MNKKQFIQACLVRALPPLDKAEAAIGHAEQLWAELGKKGYGADKATPRENKDYYAALNDRQRTFFDQFWDAFAHKKDRDGAAMRWAQLNKPDDLTYRKIISAAEREAKREVPYGQSRKMAEGWLFERRYEDNGQTRTHVKNHGIMQLNTLNNELIQVRRLYEASKDPVLLEQIEKLKAKIGEHMKAASGN